MVAIPVPVSSSPGAKPQEGAGRLINCYARKNEQGARFPVTWVRSPGLRRLVYITGHSHARGFLSTSAATLVVLNTRVYSITVSGGVYSTANLGALAGTLPVTIAINNAATPNIVAVSEDGAFNLFTGSAPTAFADTDLPVPNSVDHLDGYFIFSIGDGRVFATDLNSVSVNASSFNTEQGLALRRIKVFRGEVFAFGDKWTGVYRNAGTSPFPLERRFTIARGIVGTHAIAGAVHGWADELLWVAPDNRVYKMSGYTPEPVSTDDVERVIAATSDRSLIEASVYMHEGHAFWVITSPGEWTWEYNLKTGNWNERQSYGETYWRGSQSIYAFNKWLIGDYASGKVFEIDGSYYREDNSDPLVFRVRSGVLANFPAAIGSPRVDFDITSAVGSSYGLDPIQTDPKVSISWSRDGGYKFGSAVQRSIGAEGEAKQTVTVHRLGASTGKGYVFDLAVSDPVHVAFMGGQLAVEQRAPR